MAWFNYRCPDHGVFRESKIKMEKKTNCPACGVDAKLILQAGSAQTVETIDNGLMGRSVERLSNINEIIQKRAREHSQSLRDDKGLGDEWE